MEKKKLIAILERKGIHFDEKHVTFDEEEFLLWINESYGEMSRSSTEGCSGRYIFATPEGIIFSASVGSHMVGEGDLDYPPSFHTYRHYEWCTEKTEIQDAGWNRQAFDWKKTKELAALRLEGQKRVHYA